MTAPPQRPQTDQPTRETSSDPEQPDQPGLSRRRVTIGLCALVVAIAFESIAVATAMPVAASELNGLRLYAWAFSLFVIGMLFATVVAGRLSDRVGPAVPLIVGVIAFLIGLVVAGTATHMLVLIGGRLIQGLGGGAMNTAAYVMIAKVYEPSRRPRMFTYISSAWVVPSFVGPPVAAWITHQLSWHWVFIAVIPLALFGTALLVPTLRVLLRSDPADQTGERDDSAKDRKPAPLWAAAVVGVATAAIQYAGQRLDWWSLIPLVLGLVGLALSLPRLMPPGFMRLGRGLSAVVLSRAFLPGAYMGAEAFIPLMLVEQRQIPLVLGGATLTAGAVGWFTGAWLQSQTWMPLRRDRLITLGCLSVFAGLSLVLITAAIPATWVGLVAAGWILAGLGMGLATSSTSIAVMTLSPGDEVGRNASSLNLGDALGAGLFVGVSGTIFAALQGSATPMVTFGTVFAAMAVVAVLAVLSSLRIGALSDETDAAS